MDGIHHKAVIGLSIGTASRPGFQFLDLTGPGAPKFEAAIISHEEQISQAWLIDPIRNLLLMQAKETVWAILFASPITKLPNLRAVPCFTKTISVFNLDFPQAEYLGHRRRIAAPASLWHL